MELEDKLKNFTRFNLTGKKSAVLPPKQDRIEELLTGKVTQNRFGEFVLVRKRFDLVEVYPDIKLSSPVDSRGEFLSRICSPKNQGLVARGLGLGINRDRKPQAPSPKSLFDFEEAVFIDCETTGLAGGVGTYAFLVGIGFLSGDEFLIEQYFMQDFHQERAILSAVAERLNGFKSIVSFNGKCYDLPLLQNRWIINRIDFDPSNFNHLDLLFPCRRLWKRRIGECGLSNLEHQILKVRREIDVPSYLVPQIYFDYLRTGELEQLIPVFHHNVHDILSLLRLSVLIDQALEDFNLTEITNPMDLYSLGRIHYDLGNYPASERCYQQALSENLSPEWRLDVSLGLAFVHKKAGLVEKAKEIWHHIIDEDVPFSFSAHEELAKYYEHRRKDYLNALFFVEKALSQLSAGSGLSGNLISSFRSPGQTSLDRWEYRKARLLRKLKKLQE